MKPESGDPKALPALSMGVTLSRDVHGHLVALIPASGP
jgi:hypothetical protein